MKKQLLTLLLAITTFGALAQGNFLQDPKWGANEEERTENAKLMNAFNFSYKLKDFPQASFELKQLLGKVPAVSENLYIRGIEIYKDFFANATTPERRKQCVDSILIMFDLRAESFADHQQRGRDYVLAQKALTFNNFSEDRDKVYAVFMEAIKAGIDIIDDSDVELIGTYFANLTESYTIDDITAEQYMQAYENLTGMLANHNNEYSKQIKGDIESMFAGSGAANCENIEKIFKPQYEADPNNADLVKKILGLFSRAKCSTPFQMELLEKYYQTDPQPEIALMLAGVYEEKKEFAKALEFMNIAIDGEKDPAMKVNHLIRAAGQTLQGGNGREAAGFARRAMEIQPNNSMAAFIYASALSTGIANCGADSKAFACWLVADAFSAALRVMDANDPLRADAQAALSNMVANFPKAADLFMLGLEDGQGYTVSCGWLSGRTTVRGR